MKIPRGLLLTLASPKNPRGWMVFWSSQTVPKLTNIGDLGIHVLNLVTHFVWWQLSSSALHPALVGFIPVRLAAAK